MCVGLSVELSSEVYAWLSFCKIDAGVRRAGQLAFCRLLMGGWCLVLHGAPLMSVHELLRPL
jgi:hypothetical protein